MPNDYEDYLELVVSLKKQMLSNGLIAQKIQKQPVFVSKVLKYAKTKGYEFPTLSVSGNKNKRRGLVSVGEKSVAITTPKVTHLINKWKTTPAAAEAKDLELAKFKEVKINGEPTGLNVTKNFWLFDK